MFLFTDHQTFLCLFVYITHGYREIYVIFAGPLDFCKNFVKNQWNFCCFYYRQTYKKMANHTKHTHTNALEFFTCVYTINRAFFTVSY